MPFYPGTFTEFINTKDVSLPESFDYRVTAFMLIKKFKWRYNPIRNILIRYILRKVNGVIAVSQALKEALNQNGIGNVTVIHNGANLGFWSDSLSDGGEKRGGEGRADRASETILPVGELGQDVVLFGGRLSGAKGGELILKAMKMVVEKVPTARLLVVGKKDFYFERMKSKIDEFGISNSIVFTGWLDEKQMREAYRIASVVVTPSVCFDSFPNTNLEALAVGKPVVATCFGGSREIVKDGENGYIVNPFNVESLAKSIVDLVVNKEKSRLFGENGKRLVNADFSAPEMIKKYLNLFSK
jgi:glycosyltransferase involved in cell wall biosynthesis